MGNIINRAIFDFSMTNQSEAFRIQQELKPFLYTSILPELDKIFSQLSPSDLVISLDYLELDLGILSKGNFKEHLLTSIKEQAKEQLGALVEKVSLDNVSVADDQSFALKKPEGKRVAAYCMFLKTGLLPWWSEEQDIEKLLEQVLKERPSLLLEFLSENPTQLVIKRLIKQFSRKRLLQIFALKNSTQLSIIEQVENDLASFKIDDFKNANWYKEAAFNLSLIHI